MTESVTSSRQNGGFDVEFFWDPVCPWAWLTSRWVAEVARLRDLSVDWRFISLKLVNADKDYEHDFPDGYVAGHTTGQKLLRVAASVRAAEGRAAVGDLYTAFGGDLHVLGRRRELTAAWESGFPDYLRSIGLDEHHVAAANDERWDDDLRVDTDAALERTGGNVGTPVITFYDSTGYDSTGDDSTGYDSTGDDGGRGTGHSFFGPVISRVPRGDEALRLWDAVWSVATFPGFAELKRSIRERPQLADSLDVG